MKVSLATILGALPALVPLLPPPYGRAVSGSVELAKLVSELIESKDGEDQTTIRAAIDDLAAENDEGHERYQRKLEEAARR